MAATLIAHLIVIGGLTQLDLGSAEDEAVRAAARAEAEAAALAAATPLEPSCDGEALLRAAARAAVCITPLGAEGDDTGACLDVVAQRLDHDFILCHLDTLEMLPPVDIVQLPDAAELPSIDAEPLLEPLTPEEQQRFEEQLQQVAAAPPRPPPPALDTQVVEAARPATEEAPDDARFLSEYDSKVDEQKVARGDKTEEMVARPDPAEVAARKEVIARASQPDPSEEVGKSPEAPPNPGALSMRKPGASAPSEVPQERKVAGDLDGADGPDGDGAARRRGDGSISSQDQRKPTETARGEGGGGGGKPRAPNLRADDETLERIVGGGNVDHVQDVEEGEETALNSKRWVHASFFNRLKRMVAQTWNPAVVWRREDPDGSHFGFKSRNTQLRVSLDIRGEVQKVVVLRPCGVDALDDEAIRAFRAAQPFPNPPQALVDESGLITFDFGFHFTIDSKRTSWKIQRSM